MPMLTTLRRDRAHFLGLAACLLLYSGGVLLWHMANHALPSSDAVAYLSDSFEIYTRTKEHPWNFFYYLYDYRGWRPQLFPVFGGFFMTVSGGSPLFAVGAVSVLLSGMFIGYLYALLRLRLTPTYAAIGALAVGFAPVLYSFNLIFFSEVAYLPFITASFYYLIRSEYFRHARPAILSGLFFGLAFCIRPAEAVMIAVPVTYFIIMGLWRRHTSPHELWVAFNVLLAALVMLFYAHYVIGLHAAYTLPVLFALGAVLWHVRRLWQHHEKAFLGFALSAVALLFAYWFPAIPGLINWCYEASVGGVVHSLGLKEAPLSAHVLLVYYGWKFPLVAIVALAAVGFALQRHRGYAAWPAVLMPVLILGTLSLVMFASVVNDGQAARRTLALMVLFAAWCTALAMSPGVYLRRVWAFALACVALAGMFGAYSAALGKPQPYAPLPLPNTRAEDKRITLAKILKDNAEKYKLDKQTLVILIPDVRGGQFDPFSAALAARLVEVPFWLHPFYIPPEKEFYPFLKERSVQYVLSELVDEPEGEYASLTVSYSGEQVLALNREFKAKKFKKLKLVDVITIDGEKLMLLRNPEVPLN